MADESEFDVRIVLYEGAGARPFTVVWPAGWALPAVGDYIQLPGRHARAVRRLEWHLPGPEGDSVMRPGLRIVVGG